MEVPNLNPYGVLNKKFLHKQIFARHFVDPRVGTVKKTVGKIRR